MSELNELFEFILETTRAQMKSNIQLQSMIERARQISKEIETERQGDPILGEKEDGYQHPDATELRPGEWLR